MSNLEENSKAANESILEFRDIEWSFRHALSPDYFPQLSTTLVDSFNESHRLLDIPPPALPYALYDGEWFEECILLAPRGYDHNLATGDWGWGGIHTDTLTGNGDIGITVACYRPLLMLIKAVSDLEKAGLSVDLILEVKDTEQKLEADVRYISEYLSKRFSRVLHADFVRDAMRLGLAP
jgi:hypothetical protein